MKHLDGAKRLPDAISRLATPLIQMIIRDVERIQLGLRSSKHRDCIGARRAKSNFRFVIALHESRRRSIRSATIRDALRACVLELSRLVKRRHGSEGWVLCLLYDYLYDSVVDSVRACPRR